MASLFNLTRLNDVIISGQRLMKIEPRNIANLTLKQLVRSWLLSSFSYQSGVG